MAVRTCLFAVVLAGCREQAVEAGATGATIFAKACATCHGPAGKPTEAMATTLGVRDLSHPDFLARASIESVAQQVRAGSANLRMPAFAGALSEAQIAAVARFVVEGMPR